MKIYFAGIQLTDWADYPAQAVTMNGQTVSEAVDIVRALAKRFFWRGNDSLTLQFTVRREFATGRDAQNYLLTAFSTLPKFGLCQVICGTPGDPTVANVTMANAVLSAMPLGNFNGVEVITQFTIQGGVAVTDTPINFLGTQESMIARGKQALGAGVNTVHVDFAVSFPMGTTVIVTATIAKPSGSGSNIFATVRDDLVSVNGFDAELSGPTPDANHKLNWTAIGS
jgi:hypothetical protein